MDFTQIIIISFYPNHVEYVWFYPNHTHMIFPKSYEYVWFYLNHKNMFDFTQIIRICLILPKIFEYVWFYPNHKNMFDFTQIIWICLILPKSYSYDFSQIILIQGWALRSFPFRMFRSFKECFFLFRSFFEFLAT